MRKINLTNNLNYIHGIQIPMEGAIFFLGGGKRRPIVKYMEYSPRAAAMRPFVKLL